MTVNYTSDENGYIDGVSEQSVKFGEASESVTAMPNLGYRFKEWSDGIKTATRNEPELKESQALVASFELITNVYKYEYKFADGNCDNQDVALTYGQLDRVKLAVPTREHAQFDGWYSDKLLKNRVSDSEGNIIADDSLFYTECDTLYAKWISENKHQYKILIVYVTEFNGDVLRSDGNGKVKVQYKMSETERKICHMLTERFAFELNDLAVADFVVDEYFTTLPLSEENMTEFKYPSDGTIDNEIWAYDIPEVKGLLAEYDSVISSFSMNDYYGEFRHDAGGAMDKYAHVHFDGEFTQLFYDKHSIEALLDPYFYYWNRFINTYWHELAHTIELNCVGLYDYHNVMTAYARESVENKNIAEKLYFLNRAIVNGEAVGIPIEFWQGHVATVFYEVGECNGGPIYSYPHHNVPHDIATEWNGVVKHDIQHVIHNHDAYSVTAYALPGYEFVQWSDGVTTATRQDKNITGDFHVVAIFRKIENT